MNLVIKLQTKKYLFMIHCGTLRFSIQLRVDSLWLPSGSPYVLNVSDDEFILIAQLDEPGTVNYAVKIEGSPAVTAVQASNAEPMHSDSIFLVIS